MGFFIDLILIAIITLTAFIGYKKGLFRTLMKLVTVAVSIVCAYFFHSAVGIFLSNNIIGPKVGTSVYNSFEKMAGGVSLDRLFTEMPSHFTEWINRYTNMQTANTWYATHDEPAAKAFCSAISKPIANTISNVVSFVLLFLVSYILLRVICYVVDSILKLPGLNLINKLLGLAFGLVTGLCLAWLASEAIVIGLPELGKINPLFEDAATSSIFLSLISSFNPLSLLELIKR